MRTVALIVVLVCIFGCYAWVRTKAGGTEPTINSLQPASLGKVSTDPPQKSASESSKASAKVDFQTQIRPILETRCQPCHFSGGKVYKEMPFDRAETIKSMGTRLFTRIKDENERRLISDFLAQ